MDFLFKGDNTLEKKIFVASIPMLAMMIPVTGCSSSSTKNDPTVHNESSLMSGGGPGQPQEAFEACNGKKEGDSCTFKMDETIIESKCVTAPRRSDDGRNESLVCENDSQPKGAPPGDRPPHGQPQKREPSEAEYSACVGKSAGDACSVTEGDESVDGKCVSPPDRAKDSRMHCMPERKPGDGPRPPQG